MTAPVASTARAAADLRLLRAAVFTAVCVALSAAGHMAGSFASVPLWTLGVACAVVFAVAVPLADRERTLPGIAAGLAVGQLALHSLFSLGQQCAPGAAPGGTGSGGLSDQAVIGLARRLTCGLDGVQINGGEARRILAEGGGVDPAVAGASGMSGMSQPLTTGSGGHSAMAHCLLPSLPMLLGHLLAALVAGWLLRRGEAALWRLVRLSAPAAQEAAAQALAGALRSALALVRFLLAGTGAAQGNGPAAPRAHGSGEAGPRELVLQHSVVRRGPPALTLAA
ncbi:hypothetical protein ACIBK8_26465 [Streptomyces sp. NPDC050161]|uniref:hypothetical protein n=1 Tax=Streptomyces sp. NPDC050161 TaxID=3365604 RepID=UPI0037B0B5F8